jgi:SAM-dependent methyltransferase
VSFFFGEADSTKDIESTIMTNEQLLRKIAELQPIKGRYSNYQAWNKIELVGQRPTERRFKVYGLDRWVNHKSRVLDLGCNIGCMSLRIAEVAKRVDGIEHSDRFIKIANLIKIYTTTENCHFHLTTFESYKYCQQFDLVLALAIYPNSLKGFIKMAENIFRRALRLDGVLLLESRKFKRHSITFDACVEYLRNTGFSVLEGGRFESYKQLRKYYYVRRLE